MTKEKSVTLTAAQHSALKQKAAESGKLSKDLAKLQMNHDKLTQEIEEMEKVVASNMVEKQVLTESIAQKEKVIKDLQDLVGSLQGALRKNGTVHESELNRDLMEQTTHAAKIYLFRNVKFFEDDEDAAEKTQMLIPYLPKGLESLGDLTEEEYGNMYKQVANKGIQAAKQSVQAEGKKAARGT